MELDNWIGACLRPWLCEQLPYQANKAALVEKIADLVNNKVHYISSWIYHAYFGRFLLKPFTRNLS